jgi:hypothetical protein
MKRIFGRIVASAGTVIAIALAGAGPAIAHEGTATTVPAAAAGAAAPLPVGEPTGTGVLFGVPEFAPAAAPAAGASAIWTSQWVAIAATGVIAAGAAAVAVAVRRRRPEATWPARLQVAGALALLFAGVGHLAQVPSHWAAGLHLGVFFLASGLVLAGQGALVWLRPSAGANRSVVVTTVAMVVLYVAARQFALPLVDHQDPYLLGEMPVKLAEIFAANVALTALARAKAPAPAPAAALPLAGAYS